MKKNNLEDLFIDSFENFEADVNPSVWKNVQTGLKGASLGLLGKMLINKLGSSAIVAIVSSAAAVLTTVFVMNGTKTEKKQPKTNIVTEPKVVAQAPKIDEIKNFLNTNNTTKAEINEESPVVKNEVEPQNTNGSITIKKDKINSVLKEFTEGSIANISASPIPGSS